MIRLIQFSKKAFLLLLILIVGIHLSFAQTAGNISDAQILQIISAANQRGMSSQEVAAFAKSKGYSDQDISAIMQRANTLNANNGAGQSSSSSMLRQQVQFGQVVLIRHLLITKKVKYLGMKCFIIIASAFLQI